MSNAIEYIVKLYVYLDQFAWWPHLHINEVESISHPITLVIIHVTRWFKCLYRGFWTWRIHWIRFWYCKLNLICIIQDGWLFRQKRCNSKWSHTIYLDIINVGLWFICIKKACRTCQTQYNILRSCIIPWSIWMLTSFAYKWGQIDIRQQIWL